MRDSVVTSRRRCAATSPRLPGAALRCILVAGSLAAWIACILACRPAWSPDGTRILFPYTIDAGGKGDGGEGADASRVGIALHDLASGATRHVHTVSLSPGGEARPAAVRWLADGRRAIVLYPGDEGPDRPRVDVLDVARGTVLRSFDLPEREEALASVLLPPPVLAGRRVYLAGKSITRLDLETGEVKSRASGCPGGVFLVGRGETIFSICERRRPAGRSGKNMEFGTLDPETLEASAFADLDGLGLEQSHGFPGVSADGRRLYALASSPPDAPGGAGGAGRAGEAGAAGEPGKAPERGTYLLVFSGRRLQTRVRIREPDLKADDIEVTNLESSADGGTVFTSYVASFEKKAEVAYGLASISVATGEPRLQELFRAAKAGADAGRAYCQIEISPKGKTVAVSFALAPEGAPFASERALYLVDVSRAPWKVTKVPAPSARRGRSAR